MKLKFFRKIPCISVPALVSVAYLIVLLRN